MRQPYAWRVGIPDAGSRRSGLLLAVIEAAVGVLNNYDIMLGRNIHAYRATRK